MLQLEQFGDPFRSLQDLKKIEVHGRVRSRETLGAIRSPLARPSRAASATTLIERLWMALETRPERVGGSIVRDAAYESKVYRSHSCGEQPAGANGQRELVERRAKS